MSGLAPRGIKRRKGNGKKANFRNEVCSDFVEAAILFVAGILLKLFKEWIEQKEEIEEQEAIESIE